MKNLFRERDDRPVRSPHARVSGGPYGVGARISIARRRCGRVMASAVVLLLAIVVQMSIGIWTLLSAQGAIPIGLGLLHQGGAAIVFAIAVWHLHRISRSPARH